VRIDGSTLELRLEAHAGATTVLRLPQAPQRWIIDSVLVDGSPARALSLDASGTLLTPLDRGVHAVSMSGRLVAADSLRLAFPARPARIEVTASGWEVSGVERGTASRRRAELHAHAHRDGRRHDELESEEFPPYVRVTRTLTFDLELARRRAGRAPRAGPGRIRHRAAAAAGRVGADLPAYPCATVTS
jgi:hypothetical protein